MEAGRCRRLRLRTWDLFDGVVRVATGVILGHEYLSCSMSAPR